MAAPKSSNFLPPYSLLKHAIELKKDGMTVEVQREVFMKILQLAIIASGFDEDWYVSANADVAAAIEAGDIPSGLVHYARSGYFEGRLPTIQGVDEDWYRKEYSDVNGAILDGQTASAQAHYAVSGYREGRAPNGRLAKQLAEWMSLVSDRHLVDADRS